MSAWDTVLTLVWSALLGYALGVAIGKWGSKL